MFCVRIKACRARANAFTGKSNSSTSRVGAARRRLRGCFFKQEKQPVVAPRGGGGKISVWASHQSEYLVIMIQGYPPNLRKKRTVLSFSIHSECPLLQEVLGQIKTNTALYDSLSAPTGRRECCWE